MFKDCLLCIITFSPFYLSSQLIVKAYGGRGKMKGTEGELKLVR